MFPTIHGIVSQGGVGGQPPDIPVAPDGIWLESLFLGLADEASVTVWPDASAAGYDLTSQNTHPTFHAGVSPTGAPTVRADGSSAETASRLVGDEAFYGNGAEPFTFFFVASVPPTAGTFCYAFGMRSGNGSQPSFWFPQSGSGSRDAVFSSGGSRHLEYGTGLKDGALRVFTARFDPSNATASNRIVGWVGKSRVDDDTDTSLVGSANPLALFAQPDAVTFRFTGDVAALLWFRSALSDVDREAIVDYLTERYIGA